MTKKLFTVFFIITYILLNIQVVAESNPAKQGKKKIYTFTLSQDIMPAAWRLVKRAIEEAEAMNADYIIIRLNTYGGLVNIADSIRTKLLNAKPITIVFIDNNAASAGALISIACDSIYMVKGASIGAATVVGQSGEQMPDKYQSYMRSTMRSTAEAQGRDPEIAQAMVDDRIHIPGVIDSGYTLTFTTSEAIKNGFCEGEATSIQDVIAKLGIEDYELIKYQGNALESIIGFLLHPVVSGILMLLIVGGLYFELQTPGVGFPLIAAMIAATLYFAPLYLEGLAEHWEILLFIAGIALLAVELFLIPGFGVAGISGLLLIIGGLTLALIRNVVFDFSLTGFDEIGTALLRVVVSLFAGLGLMLIFGRNLLTSHFFLRMVLLDTQNKNRGNSSHDPVLDTMVGKQGVTITPLRPAGTVEIDNERYDVISDGEHIEKDAKVEVVKIRGNYLVVKKI